MLVELSKMEQRYDAVVGVIRDGLSVTEVAEAFGFDQSFVVDITLILLHNQLVS